MYYFRTSHKLKVLLQLRDDFQESVEMSTYLVAFIICDYTHLSRQTQRGVSVSVYTPSPYISQASFALNTTTHILEYFEDFFGVSYPLPKQGTDSQIFYQTKSSVPEKHTAHSKTSCFVLRKFLGVSMFRSDLIKTRRHICGQSHPTN